MLFIQWFQNALLGVPFELSYNAGEMSGGFIEPGFQTGKSKQREMNRHPVNEKRREDPNPNSWSASPKHMPLLFRKHTVLMLCVGKEEKNLCRNYKS